ncbi:hypothetical protein NC796_01770 [Aliifodinibius sp. S!AR15-10]|nr:hypothetical protein [Aliifodinibius sp. S!AR15-10]MDR8389846.1 hypothetical protein [Aliifodinibius sp. S!AR15-10]
MPWVSLVGQLLGLLRAIIFALRAVGGYITFELPADGRAMHADGPGHLAFGMTCFQQSFDLMTIVFTELGVFLHSNTNITRLADDLRDAPLRSFYVLHLLLELRQYIVDVIY